MSNRLRPVVGHWYNHLDKGDLFQVVALDEQSGTIEIQEFDGNLDEIDLEEWRQMEIEAAAPPEDWTGPVDKLEADDLGYTGMDGEETTGEPIDAIGDWDRLLEDEEELDIEMPSRRPTLRSPRSARRHH